MSYAKARPVKLQARINTGFYMALQLADGNFLKHSETEYFSMFGDDHEKARAYFQALADKLNG